MSPRRVAIVGSRDFPRLDVVRDYVRALPRDAVIISGGARGVDRAAVAEADRLGMAHEVYPAQWTTQGKSAGFRRNATIVAQCTEVIAFWDGVSRGTAHTIGLAERAGKPVSVFRAEEKTTP